MNKLVFLTSVITVVTASDSSSSDESDYDFDVFQMFNYEYHSSEAKEVAEKLETYLSSKTTELESLLDQLDKDNSAVDALTNYHKTVKSAENTKCSVEPPKGLTIAEDTITNAADMCADTISIDDLDSVGNAVDKIFDELENIDGHLRKNGRYCSSEESSECSDEKKKLIEKLNSLLSPSVITNLDNLIYSEAKEALDVCLQIVTEDLQAELDLHTKAVKECLQS